MSTAASLDSSSARLEAGEELGVPLQVRNNGDIVEGYRFEVVGAPAAWTRVEPPEISLYPGSATTATVTFRPPRSYDVPAGEQQFGVLVIPTEHPDDAVVPEGVVEILPFLETVAELVPRTTQGRRSGVHQVAVDNRGNVPVTAVLAGADEKQQLDLRFHEAAVTVGPGEARFVRLRVRPRKRLWRGSPITHPFVVGVEPQDSLLVELPGTYLQQPIMPKWLPKALLALLALLLALLALWFLVLKPTIESQAEEAADEAVADEAAAAGQAAEQAEQAADSANQSAGDAGQAAKKANDLVGRDVPPETEVVPFNDRLTVQSGGLGADLLTIPARNSLGITDLVLSNPQGDFGRAVVLLRGEPIFEVALENFRDLDYHFVSPINAAAGEPLALRVDCRAPGRPPQAPRPDTCDVSLFIGGELTRPAPRS